MSVVKDLWLERLEEFSTREGMLRNRAVIKLAFDTVVLRIGTGAEAGPEPRLAIATIQVNGSIKPIIPESSWRGVLRRVGELIAKASRFRDRLDDEMARSHVEPESKPITHEVEDGVLEEIHRMLREMREAGDKRLETVLRFISEDAIARGKPRREEYEGLLAPLCPICRLFGGLGLRSKLVISDTLLDADIYDRTHVSLSREAGVREEGRLFTAEYMVPRGYVPLEIIVHNVERGSGEAMILAGVLEWICKLGIEVGGFKSRGAGWMSLRKEDSEVYVVEFNRLTGDEVVDLLLDPTKGRRMTVEEYAKWLRGE